MWKRYQVADCRAFLDAEAYDELVNRIGLQTDPLRSQLTLACRFVANAIDEHQEYKRFFDYWTALEIVIQGKARKIKERLAKPTEKIQLLLINL